MIKAIESLKEYLSGKDLPGWEAQRRMSVRQDEHLRTNVPPGARYASVLALIHTFERPGVILIERQHHKEDHHSGQLSFPGGKVENQDTSLLETALREAREEIRLDTQEIHILGSLSPLYIPVSNFLVHPFVAHSDQPLSLEPEVSEVRDIVQLDIEALMDQNIFTTNIDLKSGVVLKDVPYYPLDERIVWGATAMILAELGHILESNPKFVNS
ncbi:MAG: CoA pyrophosphatase [Saprospiraceae bacterium]|nr:CoA pyrophosphatase [Saprospiraceae bacterium]